MFFFLSFVTTRWDRYAFIEKKGEKKVHPKEMEWFNDTPLSSYSYGLTPNAPSNNSTPVTQPTEPPKSNTRWIAIAGAVMGTLGLIIGVIALVLSTLTHTTEDFSPGEIANLQSLANNIHMRGNTLVADGFTDESSVPFFTTGGVVNAKSVVTQNGVNAGQFTTNGGITINGGGAINALGSTINAGFANLASNVTVRTTPTSVQQSQMTNTAFRVQDTGTQSQLQAHQLTIADPQQTTTINAQGITNTNVRYSGTRYVCTGSHDSPLPNATSMSAGVDRKAMFPPQDSQPGTFGSLSVVPVVGATYRFHMTALIHNSSGATQLFRFALTNVPSGTVPQEGKDYIFLGETTPLAAPPISNPQLSVPNGVNWVVELIYTVTITSVSAGVGSSTVAATSSGYVLSGVSPNTSTLQLASLNNVIPFTGTVNFSMWADFLNTADPLSLLTVQPLRLIMEQLS